jgi:hypothetical protein
MSWIFPWVFCLANGWPASRLIPPQPRAVREGAGSMARWIRSVCWPTLFALGLLLASPLACRSQDATNVILLAIPGELLFFSAITGQWVSITRRWLG